MFSVFDFAHLHFEFSAVRNSFDILEKMFSKLYHGLLFRSIVIVCEHKIEMLDDGLFLFFHRRRMVREDPRIADGCLAGHDSVQIS